MQQHFNAVPLPPAQLRPEIPQPLSNYLLHLLAKDPRTDPAPSRQPTGSMRRSRLQPSPSRRARRRSGCW
ncbi:hypothetical protein HEP84_50310 [Streptomyces sp. RLB1-33]|nr:hypothetical protein [Streptomyces sp. RLB1-33]QIY75947.1 hypothetical protein HEP84_50310 [Streptomyces sp. RLB1-33]